ncbi:MAG TPA: hypothetical protein GX696_03960, partial [Pseudomonadaceae bacterium]|nr:hypothetical protein [Pseudomonadaceae bacterium]
LLGERPGAGLSLTEFDQALAAEQEQLPASLHQELQAYATGLQASLSISS